MGKLIPIILALVGLGGGIGAGMALRPPPDETALENPCGDMEDPNAPTAEDDDTGDDAEAAEEAAFDYVKLNNQFVVPVVQDGRVSSLVVMSLSIEVQPGQSEMVYEREPKLRDAFLRVMFDHANAGGFDGAFTNSNQMDVLRRALREVAQKTIGPTASDVLILDIVRQDA